jgi:hypothetical protein
MYFELIYTGLYRQKNPRWFMEVARVMVFWANLATETGNANRLTSRKTSFGSIIKFFVNI